MVKVIGHRGARGIAPENTIASFRKALELKCDIIELDVHLSKDGTLVVIHDDFLDRTTNGRGRVSSFTLKELKTLDAGEGEQIPTLLEVWKFIKNDNLRMQIELKGAETEEALCRFILKHECLERVWLTSFWHRRVVTVKRNIPEVQIGLLIACNPANPTQLMESTQAENLHVNYAYIDKLLVKEVHAAGKNIIAWGQIVEGSIIDRLIDLQVDGIGSDLPNLVIERLRIKNKISAT